MNKRAKVVVGFAALIAIALLPGLVLSAFGLSDVVSVTTLAALGALIPALFGAPRIAMAAALGMTLVAPLALPAAGLPWLAAVILAAVGAATGICARWGASGLVTTAAISIVFLIADPPALADDLGSSALLTLVVAISSAWGLVAGSIIRRRRASTGPPTSAGVSWQRTLPYAGVLTIALGLGGAIVVQTQWGHTGGWFLMTFLLILQPYLQDAWRHTIDRATGTVLGAGLAIVVLWVADGWDVALYVIGALSAIAALTLRFTTKRPYWQYVLLLTPGVVILEGIGSSISDTALDRLLATLLAAVIALIIEAALAPLYRRSARSHGLERY